MPVWPRAEASGRCRGNPLHWEALELVSCHCHSVTAHDSGGALAAAQKSLHVSRKAKVTERLCHLPNSQSTPYEAPMSLQCSEKPSNRPQADNPSENCSAGTLDYQNCALRILNLTGDITSGELLSHITGIGRVYATEINRPAPHNGFATASAKLEFFTHDAANAFRILAWKDGLVIRGLPACVTWFPGRSREITLSAYASRVLMVSGLASVVNAWYLDRLFHAWARCDIAKVIRHVDTGHWANVELQFGGYWQAWAAMVVLMVELRGMTWDVGFGIDPCACSPER